MGTKVRKQLYIEPDQEALLKRLSRELKVTEAELVRRALANLSAVAQPIKDLEAWEREKEFILFIWTLLLLIFTSQEKILSLLTGLNYKYFAKLKSLTIAVALSAAS